LSFAPTVVPLLQGPFGVTEVAPLQRSLAGWAKIKATENKKNSKKTIFFKTGICVLIFFTKYKITGIEISVLING
jgi:hypothetical protein